MTTYRLFEGIDGPGSQIGDTGVNLTLGVEFYVTSSGCTLTEIRFWASGTVTGSDHACRLYRVDNALGGTLLSGSSKAFASPLVSGWNTVTLDTPAALTANQRYRAAVHFTTDNGYTASAHYWDSGSGSAGITSGPLAAPNSTDATGNQQGSFNAAGDAYPGSTFNAGNYWVDVTIDDGAAGGTTGALAGVTPAPSGALTGTHTATGVLAGVTPAPVGALAGTVTAAGALAGATPAPVGALVADTASTTGVLAGVTPSPSGALVAALADLGVLAASAAAPAGALIGTVTAAGVLAAATAAPGGSLTDLARVGSMRAASRAVATMRKG